MIVTRSVAALLILSTTVTSAQNAKTRTYRLEATPETVAYGYYWSEAKPVLRIASGDIVDRHDADMAACGNAHRLHQHGHR